MVQAKILKFYIYSVFKLMENLKPIHQHIYALAFLFQRFFFEHVCFGAFRRLFINVLAEFLCPNTFHNRNQLYV